MAEWRPLLFDCSVCWFGGGPVVAIWSCLSGGLVYESNCRIDQTWQTHCLVLLLFEFGFTDSSGPVGPFKAGRDEIVTGMVYCGNFPYNCSMQFNQPVSLLGAPSPNAFQCANSRLGCGFDRGDRFQEQLFLNTRRFQPSRVRSRALTVLAGARIFVVFLSGPKAKCLGLLFSA